MATNLPALPLAPLDTLPPSHLRDEFTMDGKIPVLEWFIDGRKTEENGGTQYSVRCTDSSKHVAGQCPGLGVV